MHSIAHLMYPEVCNLLGSHSAIFYMHPLFMLVDSIPVSCHGNVCVARPFSFRECQLVNVGV